MKEETKKLDTQGISDIEKPKDLIKDLKEESRILRKKTKKIESSRAAIKTKSREKGKTIKAHQDRESELSLSRDSWKKKYLDAENARKEAENNLKEIAALLNLKVEELNEILKEVENFKKKLP